MRRLSVIGLMVWIGVSASALGQKAANNTQNANNGVPMLLQDSTIRTMIDLVAKSVARRYDLRPDQADVARQMLEKNTMDFVHSHFNDLLTVLPQMQNMRMQASSGQDLTADQVKVMAAKMAPIYKEACSLIISENEKFHELLDEQQKTKHQADIDRMKADVEETQKKLERWKEGDYKPGEFLGGQGPARSRKTRHRPVHKEVEERTSETSLAYWEMYVKKFIDLYQLESGQIPMAWSVLSELKAKAKSYRQDHSLEFAEIRRNIDRLTQAGTTQPSKNKELKEWQTKQEKLEKPLLDMFQELAQRLMAIPSEEQIKAVAGEAKPAEKTATETKPAKAEKK